MLRKPQIKSRCDIGRGAEVKAETPTGAQFGLLSIPRGARDELHILDGQHRVLGIHLALRGLASDVFTAVGAKTVQEAQQGGCEIRLVNLERVRAFQGHVLTEQAVERVAGVDYADLAELARITLPEWQPVQPPLQFDESQHAWIVA